MKAFTPIVKFDARYGTITRVDRVQDDDGSWKTDPHEIATDDFEFVADFERGLKIGWMAFGSAGQAPDFRLFSIDEDIGDKSLRQA